MLLLQPSERPDILDHRPGWSEVVNGTFVAHDVAGDHTTMLEYPNVRVLATILNRCIAEPQGAEHAQQRAAG